MEQELLNSITAAISQSSSSSPSESLFFMNYQFDGRDSRSMQNYQDTMDRRHTAAVLSDYLDDSAKQAQALRQENVNLKKVNAELTTRLSLLIRAASEYEALGLSGSGLDSVMGGLTRMSLAGSGDCSWSDGAESSPSPTSVMDSGRVEGNADRVVLPKCISVRSTGFLKSGQAVAGSGGNSNAVGVGLRKPLGNSKISNDAQKVYVRGGKKEDQQALELQVYNQGMFKTELCNKWQETGACPYGDNCQFAHGIQELRPVLRHPRYKTEVCRMMLNGDHCPYGHRCHFRHSLTDQEKLVRSINLRAFKGLPF